MIPITLEDDHLAFAEKLATHRRLVAMQKRRPQANGASTEYQVAFNRDLLGARAEIAGYLALKPVRWNHTAEYVSGLPDLDSFIDIKGITKNWHSLIVRKDSPNDWAYLLISAEDHPVYNLIGWMWGYEAKQERFWKDPTCCRWPAYFVNQGFRDPEELLLILRERQGCLIANTRGLTKAKGSS